MAAILNSVILNLAILDSAILVLPLILTHTCQDQFLHLHKKTSLIHSDSTWWLQLSWNLSSSIQPFCAKTTSLVHSDLTGWWQPSWTLPSWFQPFCTKKLYLFILTQLDDDSHLEFCHVGFSHCHLGFRHLVIFCQIHSRTLSLHSDPDSN